MELALDNRKIKFKATSCTYSYLSLFRDYSTISERLSGGSLIILIVAFLDMCGRSSENSAQQGTNILSLLAK